MNPQDQPIIVCNNLSKYFGQNAARVKALDNLSISMTRGKLHLLMGPSGSGKTTLLSIIAGTLTQDSGQCLVNGIDLNHLPDDDRVHYRGKNIGFVFQAFNLVPSLTNEENIAVPLLALGTPYDVAVERAKELMIEFELGDKIGNFPTSLSGGQQQRIAIGRALIHRPGIIVCDEPTSNLDHEKGMRITQSLKDLTLKNQVTVIIVTHDPRITEFADTIHYLEDGKIVPRKNVAEK